MPENNHAYDLVVVGAGSAGNSIARSAGKKGWKTALVECHKLGGTCLNFGCIPSKALYHCAEIAHHLRCSQDFGIKTGTFDIDFPAVMAHVHGVKDNIRGPIPDGGLAEDGVDFFRHPARFTGPHSMQVGDEEITSDRFVLATGALPNIPPIDGLDDIEYLTYLNIFNLTDLPRKLLILGSGPVGAEFAQMFARLGSSVTLVEAADQIMPTEEPEISNAVQAVFEKEGINVFTGVKIERIEQEGDCLEAVGEFEGRTTRFPFTQILLATGRRPHWDDLDCEAAGLTCEGKAIQVDEHLKTNVDHIYACGDVINRYAFTHVASHHASVIIDNLLEDGDIEVDETGIPWVIFTDPEVAHVGQTEAEAREAGFHVRTATLELGKVSRAKVSNVRDGMGKIVVDDDTDKVLGANLFGFHAGEFVHEFALAIRYGITVGQMAETVHAYPTMAQSVQLLAKQAG